MAKKGEGAYQGKHWMQNPANRKKMLAMVAKMKRGRHRAARRQARDMKFNRIIKTVVKSKPAAKDKKSTSLVVNGWRIILDKNEIRIEHE